MNIDNSWQRLTKFIGDYCRLSEAKLSKLNRDTRVVEDLKIDGDDGDEFMEAYAKCFKVNLDNFNSSLYFNDEGFDFMGLAKFFNFLLSKNIKSEENEKLILSLSKLEDGIKIKEWKDKG